jgi:hypothetical protein
MVAFGLTVLLGGGGAAAHALWQQSATATMTTASAASTWPGPPVTSLTCVNNSSQKLATLTLQLPQNGTVAYGAAQPDGSVPKPYTWGAVTAGTPGANLALDGTSQIIKENPAGAMIFKVTATYGDGTTASVQLNLTLAESNSKVLCP